MLNLSKDLLVRQIYDDFCVNFDGRRDGQPYTIGFRISDKTIWMSINIQSTRHTWEKREPFQWA